MKESEKRSSENQSLELADQKSQQDLYAATFDEDLNATLDLETWTQGEDLWSTYGKIEQEVAEALAREKEDHKKIREIVFSRLSALPGAPANAGVYSVSAKNLEKVHFGLLFNGGVEACDGISLVHDTLPLTIMQIGVCLVSYNGQQGSWAHRLFRRDLRTRIDDPAQEVIEILTRRERREAQGLDGSEPLSALARRGVMAYAERAILKEKSSAQWRMGHGNPAPYELLTGLWSSRIERFSISLDLIRWFVHDHRRFVFVPSAPRKRHLLTIGGALNPLEFAIVQTIKPDLDAMLGSGHYREKSGVRPAMAEFCEDVGPEIVLGVYRVWEGSPPYLFYAHKDHVETAVHIAMADSILQEHRGFPMLIDLADTVCKTTFGMGTFFPNVQSAYAESGEPFRYMGERETRTR